ATLSLWRAMSNQRAELSPASAATEEYAQRVTDAVIQLNKWAEAGVQGADVLAYLRGEIDAAAAALGKATPGMAALSALLEGIGGSLERGGGTLQGSIDDLEDLKAKTSGATTAQIAFNRTMRDATREYERAGGAKNKDAAA